MSRTGVAAVHAIVATREYSALAFARKATKSSAPTEAAQLETTRKPSWRRSEPRQER